MVKLTMEKKKIESEDQIDTDRYAYLLEDGTVVEKPEVGNEYIVLPRISGGSDSRV